MSVFVYSGMDAAGKTVKGTIKAATEKIALDLLSADSIIPIDLTPGEGTPDQATASLFDTVMFWRYNVPMSVRTVFVRELATFLEADIPLLEALGVMRRQQEHRVFKQVLDDVYDRIQGGASFSDALAAHPRVFTPLLTSMVRVGETGGILGKVLNQMADWMEGEEEVKGEVMGAMAYPIVVVMMGMATIAILVTFVLPKIEPMFEGMEGALPLPTTIMMGATSLVGQYWWAMLVGGIALAIALFQARRTAAGKSLFDRIAIKAPIFGKMVRMTAISRFTRSCSALLSSGVPLLESLGVVRGLVSNSIIVAMIDETIDGVTSGESLAKKLGESGFFPASMVHLLGVGERTGRLDEMFQRVSETFEKQTRQQIKILVELLSPLLIVFLAVFVAFIAISILLPILKMSTSMR